jgi:hypothetical protein
MIKMSRHKDKSYKCRIVDGDEHLGEEGYVVSIYEGITFTACIVSIDSSEEPLFLPFDYIEGV